MSDRPPVNGLKSRAAHRAAVLRTRTNMMSLVHAMTRYDLAVLMHASATNERTGRDLETQQRIDELVREQIAAKAELLRVENHGVDQETQRRIDELTAEVGKLEQTLTQARRERAFELEAINDRIAAIGIEKHNAAHELHSAMAFAGVRGAALVDLVALAGVPEAEEVLVPAGAATRHARAATILEAMRAESSRAAEELANVGSSRAYDLALEELLDAEDAHTIARRISAAATERERDALRELSAAQRRLAEAERSGGVPTGPGETSHRMGGDLERPAGADQNSEPGGSQPPSRSVGDGEAVLSKERVQARSPGKRAGDSRTSDSGPGTQRTSGDPSGGMGLSIADTDHAASGNGSTEPVFIVSGIRILPTAVRS